MSLNRSGFESYRNYAKPWRMQRIMKDGSINPLDNMRLGQNGQHVNSTGCFGTKNNGNGLKRLSIVMRSKAPGKMRSSAKRKNTCHIAIGKVVEINKTAIKEVYNLRSTMLTYKIMNNTNSLDGYIAKFTNYLLNKLAPDEIKTMYRSDMHRIKSVRGMKVSNAGNIKTLNNKIKQAQSIMCVLA